jgi:hypothetical protein
VSRSRAGIAALLATGAGMLAVGGWRALQAAGDFALRDAWWLLLGIAGLNMLRTLVPKGALVGPAVLAGVGAMLLLEEHHVHPRVSAPAVVAAMLGISAIVVVAAGPGPAAGTTAIGWVARRRLQGRISPALRLVAVLGVVLLDLRAAAPETGTLSVNCLILGGRIEVKVPASSGVVLSPDTRASLIRVFDEGAEPASAGDPSVRIRLRGAVGGFAVHRC